MGDWWNPWEQEPFTHVHLLKTAKQGGTLFKQDLSPSGTSTISPEGLATVSPISGGVTVTDTRGTRSAFRGIGGDTTPSHLKIKSGKIIDWLTISGYFNEQTASIRTVEVVRVKPMSRNRMTRFQITHGLTDAPADDETIKIYLYYGDLNNVPDESSLRQIAEWSSFEHWAFITGGHLVNTIDHDYIEPDDNWKNNLGSLSQQNAYAYILHAVSNATSIMILMGTITVLSQLIQRTFGDSEGDGDIDDDVWVG